MTTEHDTRTRVVVSWLREDAHENAERVLIAALNEIDHTQQRRPGWSAWRFSAMNTFAKVLVATAAVLAVGIVGINLLPGSGTGPGAQASPSQGVAPSPSPSPSPTPTPDPTMSPGIAGLPEGPFVVESEIPITVTIPASGWKFDSAVDALGKGSDEANLPEAAILLWSWPADTEFYVYGDSCKQVSTRPTTPVTTADEIAAGLAVQEPRDASEPSDVTIGGHVGKTITLHVPEDADFDVCEGGEFASYGIPGDDPTRFHQGPGQIDELWILDVDGAVVIIDAMYRPNTPEALIEEMRAIAESATFEAP